MKILVSGASGLVGSALCASLRHRGHSVRSLVRKVPRSAEEVAWDPAQGTIDAVGIEGCDAVVHLAGEPIAAGRWTKKRKQRIRESRVRGTQLLADALTRCARPPRVLVSASAIGYYGDRGDEVLDERSPAGAGFTAEVCQEWEATARSASGAGIRVAHLRIGLVVSRRGGALARMLPLFRLGLGGRLGTGRQWMSWIALTDLVQLAHHVLENDSIAGPVNAVGPGPVTNAEFTRILAHVLSRPALLPAPAFLLRLALGELADELLLASARVRPMVAEETGFAFACPDLAAALALE